MITRANFGCGSSREHAVWAFEVNDINVIIAESFARIFRQNMFNCGILAIELAKADLDRLFGMQGAIKIRVDLQASTMTATSDNPAQKEITCFVPDERPGPGSRCRRRLARLCRPAILIT